MFNDPKITVVFFLSLTGLIISVVLATLAPVTVVWQLVTVVLGTASSAVLFPLSAGYYYDRFRQRREGESIGQVFREYSAGGILKIFKDREEDEHSDNAQSNLRGAFDSHVGSEIRMIGVSLRVFFQPIGPFYRNMEHHVSTVAAGKQQTIKALVCHPGSPETLNRARIETAGRHFPGIEQDIEKTLESIRMLNDKSGFPVIDCRTFSSAPYCTMVLFGDKCYYSPNILSSEAPARLPLIVFASHSHAYQVLKKYFDHVWAESTPVN